MPPVGEDNVLSTQFSPDEIARIFATVTIHDAEIDGAVAVADTTFKELLKRKEYYKASNRTCQYRLHERSQLRAQNAIEGAHLTRESHSQTNTIRELQQVIDGNAERLAQCTRVQELSDQRLTKNTRLRRLSDQHRAEITRLQGLNDQHLTENTRLQARATQDLAVITRLQEENTRLRANAQDLTARIQRLLERQPPEEQAAVNSLLALHAASQQ